MNYFLDLSKQHSKTATSIIQQIQTFEEIFKKSKGDIKQLIREILEKLYNERDEDVKWAKFYRKVHYEIERSKGLFADTTANS